MGKLGDLGFIRQLLLTGATMTGLRCLGLSTRLRFRTRQGLTLSPHEDGLEIRQTVPHLEANPLGRKGTTFGPILNFCR